MKKNVIKMRDFPNGGQPDPLVEIIGKSRRILHTNIMGEKDTQKK